MANYFPKILKFFAIFATFIIIGTMLPRSYGLRCYKCYPCENDDAGVSEVCDTEGYPVGQGYHACSFEMGAGGTRRKRCVWLRNDPDHPINTYEGSQNRPTHCHLSPMDDVNEDCFCFKDDCNKGKLAQTFDPDTEQLIDEGF